MAEPPSPGPGESAAPRPAPGWYADPQVPGGQRYWNGNAWTEHCITPGMPTMAPAGPPPMMPKTSGMAIASLVCGIVWVYGITSILAIVFAVVAKRRIDESNGWVTGGGMATAGLVLGIIGVVGTIAVIAAILLIQPEVDSGTGYRYRTY